MLYEQIQEAVAHLRTKTQLQPHTGIILGTGLGNLTDEIQVETEIPYQDIPHFPVSTVQSHKGKLVFGHLGKTPVVVMAGRFHYYEGYTMQQITFPVRVMKFLGIQQLFISNAAGGTNPHIHAGDLVFVRDHINKHPDNPLRGPNDERLGPRFPDMSQAYDRELIARALTLAKKHGIRAHQGVYVALPGPNLETPAEYEFLHRIGGDMVGMSTVPEVLVARHMDIRLFVVSVITNQCYPLEHIKETSVEDVINVAASAEPKMSLIMKELLAAAPGSGA
ncbi:MAG: purine-nucleoside phosphorylase [Saprospiraceae bacterium]|nr:purine-nucleoside phosphorylase [Saprospiraceae bacterium]